MVFCECRQKEEVVVRKYEPALVLYKHGWRWVAEAREDGPGQRWEAVVREYKPMLILYEHRRRWMTAARQGECRRI